MNEVRTINKEFWAHDARERMEAFFDQVENEKVLPSAREDWLLHTTSMGYIAGKFCHLQTGLPVATFFDTWLAVRPHCSVERLQVTDEAEAAWGANPTLGAQGRRVKEIGLYGAKAEAASWQASLGSLKPGKPPDSTKEKEKQAGIPDGARNPFKQLRDKDGTINKQAQALVTDLIKTKGVAFATAKAREAGVTIGGAPLPERALAR